MKILIFILAISIPLVSFAGGPFRWNRKGDASEEVKQQRISIAELPEDGDRPWRVLFTSAEWQSNPLESYAVYVMQQTGDMGGTVRPQHITPANPLFAQYAGLHLNDLPAIAVLVPDAQGGIVDIPTNIHGSTMPRDAQELLDEIKLSQEDGEEYGAADDEKGRPFRWKEPPYIFRPRLRRPYCPQPVVQPVVQPALPPPVTRLPVVADTVTSGRLKKLEGLFKKLLESQAARTVVKEGVLAALGGGPLLPIGALLLGGGANFLARKEEE